VLCPGTVEAETAGIVSARGGGTQTQANAGLKGLSGHAHLWFLNREADGAVELECAVSKDGRYEVSAWFSHSVDYARVQASIDGKNTGEPVDLYNPAWAYGGEAKLGRVDMKSGKHVIRFQTVGKNEKSSGYFMGIDCFRLAPTKVTVVAF